MPVNDFIQAKEYNPSHHARYRGEVDLKYRSGRFLPLGSRQSPIDNASTLASPPQILLPVPRISPARDDGGQAQDLGEPRVVELQNVKSIFDTDTEGIDDSTVADQDILDDENAKGNRVSHSDAQWLRLWANTSEFEEDDEWSTRPSESVNDEAHFGKIASDPQEGNITSAGDGLGKEPFTRNNGENPVFSLGRNSNINHKSTGVSERQRLEEDMLAASRQSGALHSNNAKARVKLMSEAAPISPFIERSHSSSNVDELALVPRGPQESSSKRRIVQNRLAATDERIYEHGQSRLASPPHRELKSSPKRISYSSSAEKQEAKHKLLDAVDEEASYSESSENSTRISSAGMPPVSTSLQTSQKGRLGVDPDYPDELLRQKSFSELDAEPFDHIPKISSTVVSHPPLPSPIMPPSMPPRKQLDEARDMTERVTLVKGLPDVDRREYLSSLPLTEWEEFGDALISEFGLMLIRIKEARSARRKTAARFEGEIRRRHEMVQTRDAEIDHRLADMKKGGLGVLRGHHHEGEEDL